jgi:cytoskeletal protein CcmA (bactofilin family)
MFNSFKGDNDHGSGAKASDTAPTITYAPAVSTTSTAKSGGPNHSIVDENLTMKGDLESDGDIMVKGKVMGNIACNLLIIDRDALVEGGISATEVIVRGRVKGKVDAERVRLERSADVDCDIVQRSFSAEEGARIKGSLGFKTDEAAKSKVAKIELAPVGGAAA